MVQWSNLGGLYLPRRGDFDPSPYGKIDVLEGDYPHERGEIQMRDFLRGGVSDPETKVGLLNLRHIMVQSILG